jgi:hypothetical protein
LRQLQRHLAPKETIERLKQVGGRVFDEPFQFPAFRERCYPEIGNELLMDKNILVPVTQLTPLQRQVAESLLGEPVSDDEVLGIRAAKAAMVKPAAGADARKAIVASIVSRAERIEASLPYISAEEELALIEEAIRASRLPQS